MDFDFTGLLTHSNSEVLKQLKIYCLFMHADGTPSPSEAQYLKDITEKMSLSSQTMQKFQAFYGEMSLNLLVKTPEMATAQIAEVLGEERTNFGLDGNKTMQTQTIWTLINLGYADSEYSEVEKSIVSYLIKRWEMDPVLVAELNDTADCILALTKQKEWVQTTSRPYAAINGIIKELDRNIATMFANIETTISEADIA